MRQYVELLEHILQEGEEKTDWQKVGNIAVCGYQMRFRPAEAFPLITARSLKGSWRAIVHELLWYLAGSTNIADLHRHNVHLWDSWATPEICGKLGLPAGELGPVYGRQWRAFNGGGPEPVDQIAYLINELKTMPDSRRLLVTAWNPAETEKVWIAPCHCMFKFFHVNGKLSLHVFQRGADVPIGLPFDVAQYALLLLMVAQVTDLQPRDLVYTICDAHIYLNQIEQVRELVRREPRPAPRVRLNPEVKDIFGFKFEDFVLEGYDPHPAMKLPVAM